MFLELRLVEWCVGEIRSESEVEACLTCLLGGEWHHRTRYALGRR